MIKLILVSFMITVCIPIYNHTIYTIRNNIQSNEVVEESNWITNSSDALDVIYDPFLDIPLNFWD
jgi:hypothetical protein